MAGDGDVCGGHIIMRSQQAIFILLSWPAVLKR